MYLSHFGEPNVLLMLGGFSLGRALQKLQVDRLLAGKVLSRAGSNPLRFLAAVMVACFLLSMALNNVVAPVLMQAMLDLSAHAALQLQRRASGLGGGGWSSCCLSSPTSMHPMLRDVAELLADGWTPRRAFETRAAMERQASIHGPAALLLLPSFFLPDSPEKVAVASAFLTLLVQASPSKAVKRLERSLRCLSKLICLWVEVQPRHVAPGTPPVWVSRAVLRDMISLHDAGSSRSALSDAGAIIAVGLNVLSECLDNGQRLVEEAHDFPQLPAGEGSSGSGSGSGSGSAGSAPGTPSPAAEAEDSEAMSVSGDPRSSSS